MRRGWFSGMMFIVLGLLILAVNFGYFELSAVLLWRLWPFFLIIPGLSLLSRTKLGSLIVWGVIALMVGLGFVAWRYPDSLGWLDWRSSSEAQVTTAYAEEFTAGTTSAALSLEVGAGSIVLDAERGTDNLLSGFSKSTHGLFSLTRLENALTLKQTGQRSFFFFGQDQNLVNLKLDPRPDWELNFRVGAAKLEARLDNLAITKFRLEAGAADTLVRFGNMASSLDASFKLGATKLRIEVPSSLGVELREQTGLTASSHSGFVSQSSGVFRSEGYDSSTVRAVIAIDSGASTLEVVRY